MGFKKSHVAILIFVIVGLFFYWKMSSSNQKTDGATASEEENVEQEAMANQPAVDSSTDKSQQQDASNSVNQAQQGGVDESAIRAQFLEALKGLGTCLDVKNVVDSDQSDAKLDNLINSVRNEIGDPVIRSQDWSNTHITLPSGEQRRIRIEMEYDSEDRIVKRLKYYSVDKENLPVPIPLNNEMTLDPQETFIASLEKDGQVTLREKGERIYFQNGEELIFTEKNDQLSDIEMNRSGKTYKCTGLETGKSSCNCL